MKKCKQCLGEVPEGAKKCQHCGSKISRSWKEMSRFEKITTVLVIIIFLFLFRSCVSDNSSKSPSTTPQSTTTLTGVELAKAKKELKDYMDLAIKATLVTSYEFSDKQTAVYVGPIWYTQTVAFKKDFLAKTAMLKKQITGYTHFEVRDAYSSEKVAEVTAFTQSLEVYK